MLLHPNALLEANYQSASALRPRSNNTQKTMAPRKVAIVGSGCAGLGAAWALKDTGYEVHLFEKSSVLGGHTNTQTWHTGTSSVPVDTGFIVMNTATYPNFIRFLREVGVEPVETEMTFSVSRDHGKFEWSGEARGIFAQRRNIFTLRHWRLIFDIIRFNQFALDLLADDDDEAFKRLGSTKQHRQQAREMSIGDYLLRHGYSDAFRDDYLIPMTAAVWSTSPDKANLEFPAKTLIRFMWNHHLLSTLAVRPPWMTIAGGSKRYIEAIVKSFPPKQLHVHTSCEVANVLRPPREGAGDVTVSWINASSGRIEGDSFDHVILACHGDEILPLLAKHGSHSKPSSSKPSSKDFVKSSNSVNYLSQTELDIFSSFETTQNICYLHSDLSLMPKRRATWTSWNYLTNSVPADEQSNSAVSLTYNMNILQHIPTKTFGDVLVTMNPDHPPEPALTQGKFIYRHPLYTSESVRAQQQLETIQNSRGVSYCGAWTKYGFHEDGFSSGLRVAVQHLGAKLPFDFVDSTYSRGHKPVFNWQDYALRIVLLIVLLWIRVLQVFVGLPGISALWALAGALVDWLLNVAESAGFL